MAETFTANHPGATFAGYTQLRTEVCCDCHVSFAAPAALLDERLSDKKSFYCPNGHSMHYTGMTDAQKLERERARREEAERRAAAERDLRADTERRLAAQKGATTRARNQRDHDRTRVAGGVCPCCNRTFVNLGRHMAGQHPDYGPLGDDECRS